MHSKIKVKYTFSGMIILFFIILIPVMDYSIKQYENIDGGIIRTDVKSYYAYLPAVLIYGDLKMTYYDKNPEKYMKWIRPKISPTGNRTTVSTMGLSILYSPFFLVAHAYASGSSTYEADGYSVPYHIALLISVYFYFIIALILLRKLLLKYFTDLSVGITLLAIGAGTNLIHYLTIEAPMSHGYSFFLFILFLYLLVQWREKPGWANTIYLGLSAGLISLIRPTNSLIVILIPLYGVNSLKDLRENFLFIFRSWKFIVLMGALVFLVWVPQLFYWKYIAGQYFYNSYGDEGSRFFFSNPQFLNILFSY
ncbi:MAG: hypothetical protein JW801_05435 [Bacteroidales bacterium]|nr:hypothetical protein [Bacteroidales bacterium]